MKNYIELDNDTNYNFRISTELKNDFNKACKLNSYNSSAVLRKFMIDFVKEHSENNNNLKNE